MILFFLKLLNIQWTLSDIFKYSFTPQFSQVRVDSLYTFKGQQIYILAGRLLSFCKVCLYVCVCLHVQVCACVFNSLIN